MSAPLHVDDVIQVRVVYHGPTNQESYSIFNFVCTATDPLNPATDADVAVQFDSDLSTALKGMLSEDWAYDGVEVSLISRSPKPVTQIVNTGAGPGIVVSPTANTQATGLLTLLTTFAGRAYRGRLYMPGVWVGAISAGLGFPTTDYVSGLAALGVLLVAFGDISVGFRSSSISWGVYHRVAHEISQVVTTLARLRFATQRRRGNYGKNRTPPI